MPTGPAHSRCLAGGVGPDANHIALPVIQQEPNIRIVPRRSGEGAEHPITREVQQTGGVQCRVDAGAASPIFR